jgi:hypothetical protein
MAGHDATCQTLPNLKGGAGPCGPGAASESMCAPSADSERPKRVGATQHVREASQPARRHAQRTRPAPSRPWATGAVPERQPAPPRPAAPPPTPAGSRPAAAKGREQARGREGRVWQGQRGEHASDESALISSGDAPRTPSGTQCLRGAPAHTPGHRPLPAHISLHLVWRTAAIMTWQRRRLFGTGRQTRKLAQTRDGAPQPDLQQPAGSRLADGSTPDQAWLP